MYHNKRYFQEAPQKKEKGSVGSQQKRKINDVSSSSSGNPPIPAPSKPPPFSKPVHRAPAWAASFSQSSGGFLKKKAVVLVSDSEEEDSGEEVEVVAPPKRQKKSNDKPQPIIDLSDSEEEEEEDFIRKSVFKGQKEAESDESEDEDEDDDDDDDEVEVIVPPKVIKKQIISLDDDEDEEEEEDSEEDEEGEAVTDAEEEEEDDDTEQYEQLSASIIQTANEALGAFHLSESRRASLQSNLIRAVHSHRYDFHLTLFGSCRNGFATSSSDMDFNVSVTSSNPVTRNDFYRLCEKLRQSRMFVVEPPIMRARVPLVTGIEKATGIAFDLSFSSVDLNFKARSNRGNVEAMTREQHSIRMTNLLYAYSTIDKRVTQLGIAVKILAKSCGISDAKTQFMGSICWILMAIAYLQLIPVGEDDEKFLPVLHEEGYMDASFDSRIDLSKSRFASHTKKHPSPSIGQLLVGFVRFVAGLKPGQAVDVRQGRLVTILPKPHQLDVLFFVCDPLLPGEVASRSLNAKNSEIIQDQMRSMHKRLTQPNANFRTITAGYFQ